ncbi:hypothetical protein F5877DRAFT_49497 [Lentinula edodes]|nr:hypothetical protein F5877DRAFT_49497 [Lentinula edodes]
MQTLSNDIRSDTRLLGQVFDIHDLLSDSRPSTAASLLQLQTRLRKMNWSPLLFVCEDLLAFGSPSFQLMETIRKSQITKDEISDALIAWRLNEVQEDDPFVWPYFNPVHYPPPRTPWNPAISYFNGRPCRVFSNSEKLAFMKELTGAMTYKTGVHIGHVHQYLWRPMNDDEIGKAKLVNSLKSKNRAALLFVCADLNRVPLDTSLKSAAKKDLISQLVHWVSETMDVTETVLIHSAPSDCLSQW